MTLTNRTALNQAMRALRPMEVAAVPIRANLDDHE